MPHDYGPSPTQPTPKNNDSARRSVIGPTLPRHLSKHVTSDEDEKCSDSIPDQATNSAPQLKKPPIPQSEESYGPALPPNFQKVTTNNTNNDDDESDDDYGPLPAGVPSNSLAQRALEERALQLKLDLLQGGEQSKSDVREQWMLELPEVGGAHLRLGARKFRKNERPDFSDRSSWTDTPDDKARKTSGKQEAKVDLKKEAELREIAKRNKEKDQLIAEYNKKNKRNKSLVDLHQEKLKKQKADDKEASTSRRPFNREIDLKVNTFDEAQKKSIMKKAMHLDDRFSRGQSKYL